jgi:endonuclease YncB( thermonuclease family)
MLTEKLVAALAVLATLIGLSWAEDNVVLHERVLRVFDGDTFLVQHDGRELHIRVQGMDCPERGQPYWKAAQTKTSELVLDKTITARVITTDQYGRPVAEVVLPTGKRLSEELVGAGLCWWYEHYAPEDTALHALEDKARATKIGLWRDDQPMPPWSFRYLERKKARNEGASKTQPEWKKRH